MYQRRAETWSVPPIGLFCCPLVGLQTPQLRQVHTRSTLTRLRRPRNISESSANARKPSRFHFANLVWSIREYSQRDNEKEMSQDLSGMCFIQGNISTK